MFGILPMDTIQVLVEFNKKKVFNVKFNSKKVFNVKFLQSSMPHVIFNPKLGLFPNLSKSFGYAFIKVLYWFFRFPKLTEDQAV